MSLQGILQQLLQSAQNVGQTTTSAQENQSINRTSPLGGLGGGALAGGALALLLGNKKFRNMGGKVASYGSIAALGAVAYRAYDEWKKQQDATPNNVSSVATQTLAQQPESEIENRSRLVLAAMISAAKADGHINEKEQTLLDEAFQKLGTSATEQQWLRTQLSSPADPIAVAGLVSTPQEGAEVYLASVLITGADSFMERAYLDELARQLNLADDLKAHLEKTALETN